MSDALLRELERQLAEGDWTGYARLVRLRAALVEAPTVPRVERAVEKLRALEAALFFQRWSRRADMEPLYDTITLPSSLPSHYNFFTVPAGPAAPILIGERDTFQVRPPEPESFQVVPLRLTVPPLDNPYSDLPLASPGQLIIRPEPIVYRMPEPRRGLIVTDDQRRWGLTVADLPDRPARRSERDARRAARRLERDARKRNRRR